MGAAAEEGVGVGAAVVEAAHGPGVTAWGLAGSFVGISGHNELPIAADG